jgi:membrane protein implicated in regulation of membrane protease activity
MKEHFDSQRAHGVISDLAAMRRFPGTEGEARARAYLIEAGRKMGVPMREEQFTYSTRALKVYIPVASLCAASVCAAGSISYLYSSWFNLVTGALVLVAIYLSFKWSGGFEKSAGKGGPLESANLVGVVPGRESRGTVLLSAHYDAKSQVMPVVMRAGLFIVGALSAAVLGAALIVTGVLEAAGVDVRIVGLLFWISLLPTVVIFSQVFNFTGNRSPGALDNAAGEAVILEVARVLKESPLENLDVRVASFGCEEVGLTGSIKYLAAHTEELAEKPCFILNFDMPFSPSGRLMLNTAFEFPPRRTSAKLNGLARDAAQEMGFEIHGIYLPLGAAADHMPWTRSGFEATGFISTTTYVHSPRDTLERINREGLRRTGEVALAVVRALDKEFPLGTDP